jgi:hypothetical protein
MGSACFITNKKPRKSTRCLINEKREKKNFIHSVNSWHIILDYLNYKELRECSKVCRKLFILSKTSKILLKFFKNKEFLCKLEKDVSKNKCESEKEVNITNNSPHFRVDSRRQNQLSSVSHCSLRTPSFKNTIHSHVNKSFQRVSQKSNKSCCETDKEHYDHVSLIQQETLKNHVFGDIQQKSTSQALFYGTTTQKDTYGTEFSKLSGYIVQRSFILNTKQHTNDIVDVNKQQDCNINVERIPENKI